MSDTTNSIFSDATAFFNNGFSVLSQGADALASNISDITKSVFGDTSKTTNANIKTPVTDSVKTNLSQKTPRSGVYVVNPLQPGLTDSTKGTISNSSGNLVASLNTVKNRFNLSLTTAASSVFGTVTDGLKSAGISGLLQSSLSLTSTVASSYTQVSNAVTQAELFKNQAISEFNYISSGLSGLTSSGSSSSLFNTSMLLSTMNINGVSIGSNVSATTINALMNSLSTAGCKHNMTVQSTASTQSLFNSLIGFGSKYGLSAFLKEVLGCSKYDATSEKTAKSTYATIIPTNPQIGTVLLSRLSDSSAATAANQQVLKQAVKNSSLTSSDTKDLEIILEKSLYSNTKDVLTTVPQTTPVTAATESITTRSVNTGTIDETANVGITTWDYSVLKTANPDVVTQLSKNDHLASYAAALKSSNYFSRLTN